MEVFPLFLTSERRFNITTSNGWVYFPFDMSYFWRQSEAHGSPPIPYI